MLDSSVLLKRSRILLVVAMLSLTASAAKHEIEAEGEPGDGSSCPASLPGATQIVVQARQAGEVFSKPLEAGKAYRLLVTGTFVYNAAGTRSDGVDLLINGERFASQRSPDHRYCRDLLGSGETLSFHVADVHRADNDGALDVAIFKLH